MAFRLVISNLLPFTSPAFAYLIAMSQPAGQEWKGTFFLILCSVPAGAIVPFLDWFLYHTISSKFPNAGDPKDKANIDRFDNHFLATRFLSFITDHLPFSFWVRPYFMEPAFKAAQSAGVDPKGAASAAVLAGHFMIWAGPPTTMYQRMFVPDWWTCIIIQPLGLFEDVAVVLATWAGQSAADQKYAEMSLYGFMLVCNVAHLYANKRSESGERAELDMLHYVVGGFTVIAFLARLADFSPIASHLSFPAAPTETISKKDTDLCAAEHSNVKAMLLTVGWVSFLAVVFGLIAKIIAPKLAPYLKREEVPTATQNSKAASGREETNLPQELLVN